MLSFEDLILLFYIWVFNTTIEEFEIIMKETNLDNTLLLNIGVWPQKMVSYIEALFGSTLPCLHSFNEGIIPLLWINSYMTLANG